MSNMRFDDRVVLVTGGGRGMGRAHVDFFATRGAKVVVSDVGGSMTGTGTDPGVAETAAKEVRAAGGEAMTYTADLRTEEGARGAVKCALDNFGQIDVIVHNAGIALGGLSFDKERLDRLDSLLSVNTRAAYAMINEAWPTMAKRKYGRIVLVGSTGMYGIPYSVFYGTAKASYIGFARCVAEEAEPHGIKINVVLPSGVSRLAEDMPESEFRSWFLSTMKPELVSAVVGFLGHEQCTISGEALTAAGGRVARSIYAETDGLVKPDLTAEGVRDNMNKILDTKNLTPFANYADSVKVLMDALGFQPTKEIGKVAKT